MFENQHEGGRRSMAQGWYVCQPGYVSITRRSSTPKKHIYIFAHDINQVQHPKNIDNKNYQGHIKNYTLDQWALNKITERQKSFYRSTRSAQVANLFRTVYEKSLRNPQVDQKRMWTQVSIQSRV